MRDRVSRRRWSFVLSITATVVSLALLGACSKSGNDNQQASPSTTVASAHTRGPADGPKPQDGGTVVMGLEFEAEGLDPSRFALAASGHFLASAVFDPLATQDADGKAVPYLASAIEASNGNKTWTVTLPEGVTFHNGTKLDAAAVKANFDAHRVGLITRLAFSTVTDVQAPDSTHVVVTLNQPWAAFATVMTSQLGYVMEPSMLTDPELSKRPIGSGPFIYDDHVENQYWKFKKNPSYRRPGLPHLDSIEFKIIPNDAERLAALEQGNLDMIHTNKPEQVKALKSSDYKVVDYSDGEEDFLILNTQKPPFDSLTARQAVAYATDTPSWIKDVMKGIEKPSNSPFAPGQLGYEEDNGYPKFNLDKAKELVKQYEREQGKPLEFTFIGTSNADTMADGQFFKERYEKAGMKVTLGTFTQIQLVAQTATGNYQMAQFRNFGFKDPDTDAVFWRGASALSPGEVSLNFPHFKNEAMDAAIARALASSNDQERDTAYKDMARIMADQLPYIWLGRPNWVLAANPRVNGIYAAANGSVSTLGGKTWLAELWRTSR